MAHVSIIIPAFNAGLYLGATLDSVLASTYRDLEVIVIDDGSSDDTAAVASKYGAPVRLVTQANAGMSASRNRGIAISDSEYVALLDSDDVWHPDKLRHQVEALQALPDHGFSYTAFTFWDGSTLPGFAAEQRDGRIDDTMSGWIYHQLILENWVLPSSLVFRRSAWQALGPFLCEDQQTDDWEYLVRASRSFQFVRLAESMVLYRQLAASLSRRVQQTNRGEIMREMLLARYGYESPDGRPVDRKALGRLRVAGWRNFADSHCARGELRTGLAMFGRLLWTGPERGRTLTKLVKSLRRRVVPKQS